MRKKSPYLFSGISRHSWFCENLEPRTLLSATYDAAANFSLSANAASPWSYGTRATLTGAFVKFKKSGTLDFGSGASGWSDNNGSPPYIGINTTGATYDSESIILNVGVLALHPGADGTYSDLRFTVPATGAVSVNYQFAGIDEIGTTTDVHVFDNTAQINEGSINTYGGVVQNSNSFANAKQGDTIDFLVGFGDDKTYFDDCTSLMATVTTASAGGGDDHLVFSQRAATGDLNLPDPVQVKIEDSKNHVITSATGGVYLSLEDASGGFAHLGGTGTASFDHGIARFTGESAPIFFAPGAFTLTATQVDTADVAVPGVTPVDDAFTVRAPHLVFLKQPTSATVGGALPVSVEELNSKNKPAVGSTITNYFTFTSTAIAGSGELTGSDKPILDGTSTYVSGGELGTMGISSPGTYTLSVSVSSDYINEPLNLNLSATSKPFKVFGNHVAFTMQPAASDEGAVVPFTAELEDAQNHAVEPDTENEFALISVNVVKGTATPPANKYISFSSKGLGDGSPGAVNEELEPGTYTLTVQALDIYDNPDPSTTSATSKPFVVGGDRFIFVKQPTTVSVGDALPVSVELVDFKGKPALGPNMATEFNFTINPIVGSGALDGTTLPIVEGVSTFNNAAASPPMTVDGPGTYTLTVSEAELLGSQTIAGAPTATSKPFKVTGFHLVFDPQPSSVAANSTIPFVVKVENSRNAITEADDSDMVSFTLKQIKGDGTLSAQTTFNLAGGYDNVLNTVLPLAITAPGTYFLTAQAVDAFGNSIDNTAPVTSKVLTIKTAG